MLRAVLDTNVIVSGVITNNGIPFEILRKWENGEFVLVVSKLILEEINKVLHYPKIKKKRHLTEKDIANVLKRLKKYSVKTPAKVKIKAIHEDPTDNHFLAAAIEAEAHCIVSGDRHLKALGSYREIAIISPRKFVEALNDKKK